MSSCSSSRLSSGSGLGLTPSFLSAEELSSADSSDVELPSVPLEAAVPCAASPFFWKFLFPAADQLSVSALAPSSGFSSGFRLVFVSELSSGFGLGLTSGFGLGLELSSGFGLGLGLSSGFGLGFSSGFGLGLTSGFGLGLTSEIGRAHGSTQVT